MAMAVYDVAGPDVPEVLYDFESTVDGWHEMGGVHLSNDRNTHRSGVGSMRIDGVSRSGVWSYAISEKHSLSSGIPYRLTAWILVNKTKGGVPLLKCDIFERGTWMRNRLSRPYDLKKNMQWQKLEVEFSTTEHVPTTIAIAIEKRPADFTFESILYVDDVRVEIVE